MYPRKKICNFRLPLLLTACLIIGIVLSQTEQIISVVFTALIFLGFIIILIFFRHKKLLIVSLLSIVFFAYGYAFSYIVTYNSGNTNYVNANITARISSFNGKQFIFDEIVINDKKHSGKIEFWLNEWQIDDFEVLLIDTETGYKSLDELCAGKVLAFRGDLLSVKYTSDPSSAAKYQRKIKYTLETIIEINSITEGKLKANETILLAIDAKLRDNLDSDAYGMTSAILFGEKAHMEESLLADFKTNGLVHLFAVSGLHVGIIASLMFFILKKLKIPLKLRYIVASILLIAYAWLCGFSPSVTRATIMLVTYYCMRLFYLPNDSLSTLAIAGALILIVSPFSLFTMSFIMSFIAVFAILTIGNSFTFVFRFIPKRVAELVSISLAVNILLLPVFLYSFGGYSLIYLVANILLIPIMPFVFCLSLTLLIIAAIPPFSPILGLLNLLFKPITWINEILANIPFAYVETPHLSPFFILLLGGMIFIVALLSSKYFFTKDKTKKMLALSLLSVYTIFCISTSLAVTNYENTMTNKNYPHIITLNYEDKCYAFVLEEYNYKTNNEIKYLEKNTNIRQFDKVYLIGAKDTYKDSLIADNKYQFIYNFEEYTFGNLRISFLDNDYCVSLGNNLYIISYGYDNMQRLNRLYSAWFGDTYNQVYYIIDSNNPNKFDELPDNLKLTKKNIKNFTLSIKNGKMIL